MWPGRYFPGGNRQVSPGGWVAPLSTAYRGIMSVTSVRLPDSFHVVRPPSPSTTPAAFRLKLAYGSRACQNANAASMLPSTLHNSTPSASRERELSRRDRPIPKFFNRAAIGVPFIGTTRRCNGRWGDVSRLGRFPRPFER